MPAELERTLIVMPALNEQASVASVVEEVLSTLHGVTCLVIDDGSSDATASEANRAGARVAQLPFNLGVGGAMRLGFRYALDNGFDNVVQVDSDGQHYPSEVPTLLRHLEQADIVIGTRFSGDATYRVRGPRKWAMSLLASVLSRIAHTKLTDTTSGFKAMGPRAVRLFASNYPAEYLGDTIEALVIASKAGLRIVQVPTPMRERTTGKPSHNPLKSAVYLGRASLALLIGLLRPTARMPEGAA
ncbi:glycosyltransferase family 2 protein [Humibacter ginsenosidimutans]|uniref:Glycosyltransferase family 2 protein n=1 Tax=Humibacter ginsenosidimutans TaxID=2599293 RepID=A0A5B8M9V9_9MICO|nr:glycosyltransferase family 2 protein [Humibacter ginsenosidimutans]QDZ16442.1 glycosyltransferase family 2 protein [Humibacter ginsenosidimutans]